MNRLASRWVGWTAAAAMVLTSWSLVWGAPWAAPTQAQLDAGRKAAETTRKQIEANTTSVKALEGRLDKIADLAKDAIKAQITALNNVIKAQDNLAKAQEQADTEPVKMLSSEVARLTGIYTRASEQTAAREAQAANTLSDTVVQTLRVGATQAAKPDLDAYLAARAKAAQLWDKVAQAAAKPEATTDSVDEVEDAALTAAYDASVAYALYVNSNELSKLAYAARTKNAEDALAKLEEIRKQDRQILENLRTYYAANVKTRTLARQRAVLMNEYRQALAGTPAAATSTTAPAK